MIPPCRWVVIAIAIGLPAAAADGPAVLELPCGGRLAGRLATATDATATTVVVDSALFARPVEFHADAIAGTRAGNGTAVGGETSTRAEPRLHGLPGRVGFLMSGGDRMLGCLTACEGGLGWQPFGAVRPVRFASRGPAARITYRGLDAIGGLGVVPTREGSGGGWAVADLQVNGPAARDGRLRVGDRIDAVTEGDWGRPVETGPLKADAIRTLLRGPIGSTVRLRVRGDSGVAEDVLLVRDAAGCDDLAGAAAKDALDRAVALQVALAGDARRGPTTLHLCSGEAFGCAIIAADERRIEVRFADGRDRAIPVDQIRAIELSTAAGRPILKQKLVRLLTVPRTQQAAPPTHVIRMIGGDYLRGRLLGIDEQRVIYDVAGATKSLPRQDVARIIRLATAQEPHPSLLAAMSRLEGIPIVVIGGDGRRQAVAATGMDEGAIVGESPTLGPTAVPLGGCADVLVGAAIDEVADAERPYAQWVLAPAPPPKAAP